MGVHILNQQFYVMGRYGEGISSDKVDIMRPKPGFFAANMMGSLAMLDYRGLVY